MNRVPVRALLAAMALGLVALFVAACGSSDDSTSSSSADSTQLTFKLTDDGCDPVKASAPAGPIDFTVENGGTSKYTEL